MYTCEPFFHERLFVPTANEHRSVADELGAGESEIRLTETTAVIIIIIIIIYVIICDDIVVVVVLSNVVIEDA